MAILERSAATAAACFLLLVPFSQGHRVSSDFVERLFRLGGAVDAVGDGSPAKTPRFLMNTAEKAQDTDVHHRRMPPAPQDWDKQQGCDIEFASSCLTHPKCVSCFATLATEDIDWASVAPDTPCRDVVKFLFKGEHCTLMRDDNTAIDQFCTTFDACVVWDQHNYDNAKKKKKNPKNQSNETTLDCSTLTTCDFEGFHKGFIGDGICHDALPGCYNSAVCGYDGGDCCEDTCRSKSVYVPCGTDGYACRDPVSANCDSTYTTKCSEPIIYDDDVAGLDCGPDEILYRLVMYDSFGDGWDATELTITPNDNPENVVFKGGLKRGSIGTVMICLSTKSSCYHIDVAGGIWGNEVSWEVKPMTHGTPAVAAGGSPMDCTFPVGGNSCPNTCDGKANKKKDDDPDYKTYKILYECIQDKCLIQVGACMADEACAPCFKADAPEYCYANDNFNAVINCGLCQCTEKNPEFCHKKVSPGSVIPSDTIDEPGSARECTPKEIIQGSNALLDFSTCTSFDQVNMLITDFDQNNFGALDVFETCAHTYQQDAFHGGYTAMGCMKILKDAIDNPIMDSNSDAPKDAISSLARLLYEDGEEFCDCAKKASDECPLCPKFVHFKTLLYESLDACHALDEIDCAAWNEFYDPCKTNLEETFGVVDFSNPSQCDYIEDTCGGAGAFPAFRRLNCGGEIPKSSWDFYNMYSRSCLKDDRPASSVPATTPAPTPRVMPTGGSSSDSSTPWPTAAYVPEDDYAPPKKEYVPDRKTSHFWRNILIIGILCGGGFWIYKRRQESFSFVRYRRAPRNFGGDNEMMYSGLAMDSSTSFEPPTLPPPPSAIPDPQQA